MTQANTDFGRVADDLRRAAGAFALLTSSATAFGSSLQKFREFERQLTLTNAIAGGTVQNFNAMSDAAREFSLATTVSATEAATSLQQLAQAGFTAQESLDAMAGVLLLAQATLTDVGVTSDIVSSNIRAFGLNAGDASRVSNVFAASVTSSLATLDKLSFAFRQVAPVAKLANLSIEESTALLNQLFNVGLRGEQAGTALRNIIIRLVRPLGEASDILREAGIATRTATGELRPLVAILKDLNAADLDNAELARIFETEALAGVVTLLKAIEVQNGETLSSYEENLEAITGTNKALELAVANLDTFDGAMKLFRNTIDDVQKSIGEALAPSIINVTEYLTGLIETFRGFDAGTQRVITTLAGVTLAVGVVAASINALSLLVGGVGGKAVVSFLTLGKAANGNTRLFNGFAKAVTLLGTAFTSIISIAGRLFTLMRSATIAFALFLPGGPLVAGVGLITAALGLGVAAWRQWGIAAAEAGADAEAALAFDAAAARGQDLVNNVIPDEGLDDLELRVSRLKKQLELAGTVLGSFDQIGAQEGGVARAGSLGAEAQEAQRRLEEEFAEIEAVIEKRDEFVAQINEALNRRDNATGIGGRAVAASALRVIRRAQRDFLNELDAETKGLLQEFDIANNRLQANAAEAEQIGRQAVISERQAVENFLLGLEDGSIEFEGALAAVTPRIQELLGDVDARRRIGKILAAYDNITQEDVVATVFQFGGGTDEEIAAALNIADAEGQKIRNITQNLLGAKEVIDLEVEKLNIALLEQQAQTADNVGDAVAAAQQAGLAQLIINLEGVAEESRSAITDALSDFGFNTIDGVNEAISGAFAGTDFEGIVGNNPDFARVISGEFVIDAINAQIDASTTVEEAEAIAQAEFEKYAAILTNIVAAIADAMTLSEEEEANLAAVVQSTFSRIEAAVENNLGTVGQKVERVRSAPRFRSRGGGGRRRGGGGGKSAEQQAKEALRDARKIEDAFRDANKQMLKARQTFLENAEGLDVSARVEASIELDVAEISAKADEQILRLKRKLEDLKLDGTGGEELQRLQSQYSLLITEIERARDAEIAAATSFEAQMARRSDAIDLYIRDLKTLAAESESTFTQVGAGIQIAFAEFNREIVTLTDITTEAVTGYLDAITQGISDFVFDNENAMENFKANMLNISKKVFEGFTKSLLQQAVSSLTGGGGSLFGNSAQPGPGGSEQPGVGGGGLLGKIFGGLFGGNKGNTGGGTGAAGPAGAGQGAAEGALGGLGGAFGGQQGLDITAIQQVIDAFAQEFQQTLTQFNQEVVNTLNQFGNEFAGALNEVTQAIRQMGQQVAAQGAAGGSVSFSPIGGGGSIGGGGGVGGGVGGIFMQLLGSFASGFAAGGYVSGAGTGRSDSIPAMLSNGEFVINASAAGQTRPLLEAINAGKVSAEKAQGAMLAMFGNTGAFSGLLGKFIGGAGGRAFGADGGGFAAALLGNLGGIASVLGFKDGGMVGGPAPTLNSPAPRPLLVPIGARGSNTNINNNQRGGDRVYNVTIHNTYTGTPSGTAAKRTHNQQAKQLASAIERAKRDT